MAKPHVFIWWDEFDRQDLPCICMRCVKKKADWTAWSFMRYIYKNGRNYRQHRKTEIPMCAQHGEGMLKMALIAASDYDDHGVWVMNVHEDYVAALKKHRKAEVESWKAENDGADPDDFDEHKLPPGLRKEPTKPVQSKTGFFLGMGFFVAVMAVVLGGFVLICGGFGVLFLFLGMRRPR